MTENQRRPGFRLPWSSDVDETADAAASPAAPDATAPATEPDAPAATAGDAATNGSTPVSAPGPEADAGVDVQPGHDSAAPAAESQPAKEKALSEPPTDFLRDLIAAMRRVADEARLAGVAELKSRAEEAVRGLEADAEKRRRDHRERAEADITGVGEWARSEAERIKNEAEQRVTARRAQLEQQLAAEATHIEAEAKALRARVDDYEREVEAYHAQLAEITDPAAFAAAAKRMPSPPSLQGADTSLTEPKTAVPQAAVAPWAPAGGPTAETSQPAPAGAEEARPDAAAEIHPAEEEVLAARLAELDEKLEGAPATEPAPMGPAEAVTTDIVVKGLGSFGAITGFRQSLASQDGISGVALSLGQTGEFVFRATHAAGLDVAAVITGLEGSGATIEQQADGGLRVTLERAR